MTYKASRYPSRQHSLVESSSSLLVYICSDFSYESSFNLADRILYMIALSQKK